MLHVSAKNDKLCLPNNWLLLQFSMIADIVCITSVHNTGSVINISNSTSIAGS